MSRASKEQPGPGVDKLGNPVVDPTANVIALTEAAVKRLDDLREVTVIGLGERISHVEAMAALRAEHANQLNEKESSRLDAIRQVDVLAVSAAAAQTLSAVTTLATTTSANAENIRLAVVNTATTMATQLTNTVTAINERLAALERSSYEGKGKQAYTDPMLADLVMEMRKSNISGASTSGQKIGSTNMLALVVSLALFVGTVVGILSHFLLK